MENEMLDGLAERLDTLVTMLEGLVKRQEAVGPIEATVDGGRELELERRLAESERVNAELRASAAVVPASATFGAPGFGSSGFGSAGSGRKTLPVSLMAKHGVSEDGISTGALDAALVSLSLEQRIAVKAQLLRAGLAG